MGGSTLRALLDGSTKVIVFSLTDIRQVNYVIWEAELDGVTVL